MKANKLIPLLRRGDGSTLSLDFTAMSSLDSRFTFSRTSLGTYVGPDGYLYGADSSTSSQTIGNSGTKTFTLAATANVNRRYSVGDTVIAASGANNMSGTVTSYDPSTQVLSFTASSSTGSGTFTSWSIGTRMARFDYDPTTLAPRGLLIEGSATNVCVQSAEVRSGPAWSTVGLTTQGPSIPAPDGTNSGVEIVAPNGSGVNSAYSIQSVTTALATYTFSVFLKPKGVAVDTNLILQARDGAAVLLSNFTVGFNHSTYQVSIVGPGTWTATSSNVVPFGNGWYRVSMTGTTPATTAFIQMSIRNGETGNGTDGVYAWGAQLEAGSGASSYIPTGASTVQRAADSCSIAASASWLNTANGTFVVNWHRGEFGTQERGVLNTDYVSGRWLGLSHTSASNTVNLSWWSGAINRTTGAATNKAAYAYGQTTGSGATLQLPVRLCVNNSAVATGTFGNGTTNGADVPNPVNWTNFVIGAASSGAPYITATRDWLNNCIRSIKYWPTVLPDATLQNLTQ